MSNRYQRKNHIPSIHAGFNTFIKNNHSLHPDSIEINKFSIISNRYTSFLGVQKYKKKATQIKLQKKNTKIQLIY